MSASRKALLLVLVPSAVLFSLMTVALQVRALGIPYLETGPQLLRHKDVLKGSSINPWQYRILSEFLVEGVLRLVAALSVTSPVATGFILFRVAQNTVLFLLAAIYYRRIGLGDYLVLVGLSFLAWGMTHSSYNSDLQFSTYSDVIFYLLAGIAILRGATGWIPPIAVLAALNRETSLLIPFMLFANLHSPGAPPRRKLLVAAGVALALGLGALVGLRWIYGPRPQGLATPPIGLDTLRYNLGSYQSWVFLFATVGLLPAMALASWSRWPRPLRAWFWVIVPAWCIVHSLAAVVAEARLFLVPQALVFIPGALFGVSKWSGGNGGAARGPDRMVVTTGLSR